MKTLTELELLKMKVDHLTISKAQLKLDIIKERQEKLIYLSKIRELEAKQAQLNKKLSDQETATKLNLLKKEQDTCKEVIEKSKQQNQEYSKELQEKYELPDSWGFDDLTGEIKIEEVEDGD